MQLVRLITSILSVLGFCLTGLMPVSAHEAAVPTPPAFPIYGHVINDCVPDAIAYMARLAQERPDLKTHMINVERDLAGKKQRHVMTLVEDARGRQWLRDEYYGVFPIDLKGVGVDDRNQVIWRALQTHIRKQLAAGIRITVDAEPVTEPREYRKAAEFVHKLIPGSRCFEVGGKTFVLWQEDRDGDAKVVMLFTPDRGTGPVRVSNSRSLSKVASAIARFLKYGEQVSEITPRSQAAKIL